MIINPKCLNCGWHPIDCEGVREGADTGCFLSKSKMGEPEWNPRFTAYSKTRPERSRSYSRTAPDKMQIGELWQNL